MALAFYNLPAGQLQHWQDCYPEGTKLAIKEPFLKKRADGTYGVRVEDPGDIVVESPVCNWSGCQKADVHMRFKKM